MRFVAKDAGEAPRWLIVDDVVHLREWGTTTTFPLPAGRAAIVGAARNAWLRITAPPGLVIKELARLARVGGSWTVQDLRSPMGIRLDGAVHRVGSLSPGVEIEIGGIRLVAESRRLIALRAMLVRLLGTAPERGENIDRAMRTIRMAALHHQPLLVCGSDGDFLSAAGLLHRHTLGAERQFVVCPPPRLRSSHVRSWDARDAIIIHDPRKALKAAAGGTLCIWQGSQLDRLAAAVRWPAARAQIIICGPAPQRGDVLLKSPIVVPPLRKRAAELDRVIEGYLLDACEAQGGTLVTADRNWIRRYDAKTLARIERAAWRVVVLRGSGSVTQAARVLGMAHSALIEWVARRNIPGLVADESRRPRHD